MTVNETSQRIWRGRRKVMRLQRDLVLAQMALWPTLIVSAILLAVAVWAVWQRKSRRRQPEAVPPVTDVAMPAAPRA